MKQQYHLLILHFLFAILVMHSKEINTLDKNYTQSGENNLGTIRTKYATIKIDSENLDQSTSTTTDTYVPDDNFEQVLIDLGYDTLPLDDYVPTAAINTITKLTIGGKGITDFTGIEDFVKLTELDINNNRHTSIDVTALSDLESLLTHSNSNLTSVDVTGLTKLSYLRVNNTGITDLDISTNTGLEDLWTFSIPNISGIIDTTNNTLLWRLLIGNSGFTGTLDISHLSNLTYLDCRNNDFSSININNGNNDNITFLNATDNPNLDCINVDNETASVLEEWEKDTAAVFSQHCYDTYVPDDNFENYLETHDANGNTVNLGDLSSMGNGIENDDYVRTSKIETVTNLMVIAKGISNLTGISDFTVLEVLRCESNTLTQLDVTQNTQLTHLYCNSNQLTGLDVTQNTALTVLSCNSNPLKSLDVTKNILLEDLKCYRNELTSLDISQNTALVELDCYTNQITSLDITKNTLLNELYCNDNALTNLNLKNGNNANLDLKTDNNENLFCILVDNIYAPVLSDWDKDNQAFYSTDCRQTNIPDGSFENYLETHDANGNTVNIGDPSSMGNGVKEDGQVTTEKIEIVTTLNIGKSGISYLTGIADFTALEVLNCTFCALTELDITKNTQLTHLYCGQNQLTQLDITKNLALKELHCFDNEITSLDLINNTLLENLECHDNELSSLDLTQNTALTYLECNINQIAHLNLSKNTLLNEVYCGDNPLSSLNLKNGNNTNLFIEVEDTPDLFCISVDDASAPILSTWDKDNQAFFSTDCRQTNIPDGNFENYLETHDADGNAVNIGDPSSMGNGVNNDGQVTTEKIETVTNLTMVGKGISDLTGISDFAALEVLRCESNTLTQLDITQNTNLTQLHCNFNQLTELDLTQNTALAIISCHRNFLEHLDVSKNILLEDLKCYGNELTSLDVTQNTVLLELDCYANQITHLNFSKNTLLNDVSCGDNPLSSLNLKNGNNANLYIEVEDTPDLFCILVNDTSNAVLSTWDKDDQAIYSTDCGLTNVPDDSFEAYLETHDADGNIVALGDPSSMGNGIENDDYVTTEKIATVTQLNIENQGISDLTGIANFTALEILDCSNNALVTLDITTNTLLKHLYCSNNQLLQLDVTQNTALIELSFNNNSISSIDVTNNILLEKLDGALNDLTSLNVSKNIALTALQCYENQISRLDLTNNILLTELHCYENTGFSSLNLQNGNNTNLYIDAGGNPILRCILVDDTSDPVLDTWDIDSRASYSEVTCDIQIAPKVFLQGPLLNPNPGEEALMRDDLRNAGYIPTESPYNLDSINDEVLEVTGNDAIVDWVYLELRDRRNESLIITNFSALLQRDGDVVALDGVSPISIPFIPLNDYYVSIKHRNHLGIMTDEPIDLTNTVTTIDFTDANNQITYLSNAQTAFGMPNNIVAMWSGNVNEDDVIQATGTNADTAAVLSSVLNDPANIFNFPTYTARGYHLNDTNMDGKIQYTGTTPDSPFILQNVLEHPGNFLKFNTYQIQEQIPNNFIIIK